MSSTDKLLLVDDEEDIVSVLKIGLEKQGFAVDAFRDPQEALEHFKPVYYDQVITDIKMPKMSGFDFAREIFAKDPRVHLCFLTSFEILESEARKVFPNLPTYCFIKKPIMPSALADHIRLHNVKVKVNG